MRLLAIIAALTVFAAAASPPAASPPAASPGSRPPNELGRIMVLEYHRLGEPEGPWYRSEEGFRRDLEALHARGYRPITVRQLARGEIDVPAGFSPVVFTMDDSSLKQFYFLEGSRTVDPHTMVGIWEAFRARHPDWRYGATWCVLPGAKHPSDFWGEPGGGAIRAAERNARIRDKLAFLVSRHHEICSHTLWHATLSGYSDSMVQQQIARGEEEILKHLPGYQISTFALPLGKWPRRRALAWEGCYQDTCYRHDAVLMVSGGPSASPFSTRFDAHAIPRIIVAPGALERWLDHFDAHPEERFISDGDPSTIACPRTLELELARERLDGKTLRLR